MCDAPGDMNLDVQVQYVYSQSEQSCRKRALFPHNCQDRMTANRNRCAAVVNYLTSADSAGVNVS